MEKVCPFCGAAKREGEKSWTRFECNHLVQDGAKFIRPPSCYERQLAQQAELLRQALNFAIIVKNYPLNHEGELVYSIDDINNEAKALIPTLKKALEGVK